jgi:hypothetical protein
MISQHGGLDIPFEAEALTYGRGESTTSDDWFSAFV